MSTESKLDPDGPRVSCHSLLMSPPKPPRTAKRAHKEMSNEEREEQERNDISSFLSRTEDTKGIYKKVLMKQQNYMSPDHPEFQKYQDLTNRYNERKRKANTILDEKFVYSVHTSKEDVKAAVKEAFEDDPELYSLVPPQWREKKEEPHSSTQVQEASKKQTVPSKPRNEETEGNIGMDDDTNEERSRQDQEEEQEPEEDE